MYDWLLFFHVFAAFCYVSALVWFTVVILAGRRTDRPARALDLFGAVRVGNVLVAVGAIGTVGLGVWLAIYVDGYELWDGWILASLLLWALAAEFGRRTGKAFEPANVLARDLHATGTTESAELNAALRSAPGLLYHVLSSITLVAILWLMIYKPGA